VWPVDTERDRGDQTYRAQSEAIHDLTPQAQDLTNIRYRYKNRVDEIVREENRAKSHTRSRVEHLLAVIKLKFGYTKARYLGVKKNATRVFTLCTLSNLFCYAADCWYLRGVVSLDALPR
jgi:IS5 family transposase